MIQAAAAPCYLTTGSAPEDGAACTADEQQQTDFDGTQTYYNSGFLPEAAVFKVKLSEDIAPGTYNYYCLLHREGMAGTITVVDKDRHVRERHRTVGPTTASVCQAPLAYAAGGASFGEMASASHSRKRSTSPVSASENRAAVGWAALCTAIVTPRSLKALKASSSVSSSPM